jgi:hypothetical protein
VLGRFDDRAQCIEDFGGEAAADGLPLGAIAYELMSAAWGWIALCDSFSPVAMSVVVSR